MIRARRSRGLRDSFELERIYATPQPPMNPTHRPLRPASHPLRCCRQGVIGFVIINYAETTRFRVILTSAMALNDPQNPQNPPVIIESILQRKFHRD